MMRVKRLSSKSAWARAVADDFVHLAELMPTDRPVRVCLAGGSTPEPAYRALATAISDGTIPFPEGQLPRYTLIVGDERADAATDSERNETMIRKAFEGPLEDGLATLVGWHSDPSEALYAMDRELAAFPADGSPLFDICYLGLGADGHTAGVFPGSKPPMGGRTLSCRAPERPFKRLSCSLDTLASAGHTRFLLRSRGKEMALARLLEHDRELIATQAAARDTVVFVLG